MKARVINQDSVTFSLNQQISRPCVETVVLKKDTPHNGIENIGCDRIVILVTSLELYRLEESGIRIMMFAELAMDFTLGVRPGYHAICIASGGKVCRTGHPVHGKNIYEAIDGIQFHPEGTLCNGGIKIINNFLCGKC